MYDAKNKKPPAMHHERLRPNYLLNGRIILPPLPGQAGWRGCALSGCKRHYIKASLYNQLKLYVLARFVLYDKGYRSMLLI